MNALEGFYKAGPRMNWGGVCEVYTGWVTAGGSKRWYYWHHAAWPIRSGSPHPITLTELQNMLHDKDWVSLWGPEYDLPEGL